MKTQEEHYNYFIKKYTPDNSLYVGWSSKDKQHLIFERIQDNLSGIPGINRTILDVGCGIGDFSEYVKDLKYTGIDINTEYLLQAKIRHGEKAFTKADILDYKKRHDCLVACGTFNLKQQNQMKYLQKILSHMYSIANTAIIVTLTSKFCTQKVDDIYYYDPGVILNLCLDNGWRTRIDHSYRYDDFMVVIEQ